MWWPRKLVDATEIESKGSKRKQSNPLDDSSTATKFSRFELKPESPEKMRGACLQG